MKKILMIVGGVLIVIVLIWLLISKLANDQNLQQADIIATQPIKFNKAPDFNLQNYQGKTVSLADFKGKPLVINSWAIWCPFCLRELEDFARLQQELGDQIIIIAINRAESLSRSKKYTDELGVTDTLVFLIDPQDSFYRSIGGFSMPETIFVDSNGNTVLHKRGPMNFDEIKQKVNELFAL